MELADLVRPGPHPIYKLNAAFQEREKTVLCQIKHSLGKESHKVLEILLTRCYEVTKSDTFIIDSVELATKLLETVIGMRLEGCCPRIWVFRQGAGQLSRKVPEMDSVGTRVLSLKIGGGFASYKLVGEDGRLAATDLRLDGGRALLTSQAFRLSLGMAAHDCFVLTLGFDRPKI